MASIELIKKLREATGCGMSDCNKALTETNNDYDKAVDWLRKKGLSSAEKKSARVTTEGLVGTLINGNKAVIVEVNSETDFVAKNDKFQAMVNDILNSAMATAKSSNFLDDLNKSKVGATTVEDLIKNNISVIGENLKLRRANKIELQGEGLIVDYIHTATNKNMGKIGVLVALKSSADKSKLEELGKQIAMHIAATKPDFLDEKSVSQDRIDREKAVLVEQARNSGKPENIIEKMIEGRMRKFYEEVCLLSQNFVMDDSIKIQGVLDKFKKENGAEVSIQEFCFYVLGQGIEKKEVNFAEEVASMTK